MHCDRLAFVFKVCMGGKLHISIVKILKYDDFRILLYKIGIKPEFNFHSAGWLFRSKDRLAYDDIPISIQERTSGGLIHQNAGHGILPSGFEIFIRNRINDYDFVQLKNGNGYDHNWVLNTKGDITRKCATLESPLTGIVLDVYTNEPGIQVYAGNFLDGSLTGKKGITYNQRASVCLETQKYPDTPNKAEWPSAVLRPGEKYTSQCIFKFSVDK